MTALGGGVGSARLVRGVTRAIEPERLTVVVNTGDDETFFGLHVSPDLDTAVYNLSGVAHRRGWGLAGDPARTLEALTRFYGKPWFRLGDGDLATHLYRTDRLRRGASLHRVTAEIAKAFGVRSRVLPATNDRVATWVTTARGERLPFQVYFVKRAARDPVRRFSYRGLRRARPAPGVIPAIRRADVVLVPPSNPFTSLAPILGVRGVRHALESRHLPVVAVSPLRGGRAVRGPLGQMLSAHGLPVDPTGIARIYAGLLDGMVVDPLDRRFVPALEREGIRVSLADVRMPTVLRSRAVARVALDLAESIRGDSR